jgi:hypothetical protein
MPETTSKKLVWDNVGEKFYETGVDRGVLFPMADGAYGAGEAWNGLMSVDEKPSGAEPTALYANNKKYLELMSAEEFGMTIGAYTFPAGFRQCLGVKEIAPGVYVGQQTHVPFGFSYRTLIGNDTKKNAHGYKIHLVYGATAKPSEKSNKTVNESPEAAEMSWECTTTPVEVPNCDPAAHIEIDSTTISADKLKALEDMLYGTETVAPKLPLPNELAALLSGGEG